MQESAMSHTAYPPPGTPVDKQVTGAAAIVIDSAGRVLLQRRADNGHWGLPGGGIDLGESASAACIREVREETGYDVDILRLHGVYSDPVFGQLIRYPDGRVAHIVAIVFVCKVVGGTLTISDESTDAAWCEPGELPEPMAPSHRVRLTDFWSAGGLAGTTTFVR
jgi:ADP-ribose pyrophosphatase YjhB (NUDIX family)